MTKEDFCELMRKDNIAINKVEAEKAVGELFKLDVKGLEFDETAKEKFKRYYYDRYSQRRDGLITAHKFLDMVGAKSV